ncbi:MAG: hypothetical protein ABI662_01865 [Dermatophilaceae bacterium]
MSAFSVVTETAGRYVHWGVVLISLTNLLIILAMVALFILALVVPFPSGHDEADDREGRQS